LAPDPYEARVRALLGAHPAGIRLACAPLVSIGSSAVNRCWRADTSDGPCFVRLGGEGAPGLGADWDTELALLEIASGDCLAPAPLLAVTAVGLLVTEFIEVRPGAGDTAADQEHLLRVGALLHAVHAMTPRAGLRRLDFAIQARRLEAELVGTTDADARLRPRAARVFERLQLRRGDAVPCHNDVHRANILDDGRLRLVDWEYGGLGDAMFDLAGFASHHALDDASVGLLLAGYGAGVDHARLDDARWAYDYVQWLWYRLAARLPAAQPAPSLAAAESLARRLTEGD
jgi:Ser/Thr protein kinase RdoA (MazF antagonist)